MYCAEHRPKRRGGLPFIAQASVFVCLALACKRDNAPPANQLSTPPPARPVTPAVYRPDEGDLDATTLRCMKSDRGGSPSTILQFGKSASDPTTGDVAAVVFRLVVSDTGITGERVEVAGEGAATDPFTDLALDLRQHTIRFAYGEGRNRSQFTGSISCDSIWGRWDPYVNQVRERMGYPRMR